MKRVNLSRGFVAIVDDADYERVSQHKWTTHGNEKKGIYAARNACIGVRNKKSVRQTILMHRFILGLPPGRTPDVDHRDGDGLNNRRDNLRPCTHAQNCTNMRKRRKGSSQFKGVWFKATGRRKWIAQIVRGGKMIYSKAFYDETEAAIAYNTKSTELFGEFARLNKIPDHNAAQ